MKKARNPRKALLIISDGGDNSSRYTETEIKKLVREADVQIYAIGITDPANDTLAGFGRSVLEEVTRMTGGRAFFPTSINELEGICAQIGVDLKNQYVIGYRPLNLSSDGKWRKIKVKIKGPSGMPSLSVRAKTGYYASTIAKVMR